MSLLTLIPARAGSKRLPNKNSKCILGKPLIDWTIDAAQLADLKNIVVSTDSKIIADLAVKKGLDIPFIRPSKLAADHSSMFDVAKHCLEYFESQGQKFKTLLLLQPTSPLRTSINIRNALEKYENSSVRSLVSITKASHPTRWHFALTENKKSIKEIVNFDPKARSQDYNPEYYINGAIYITSVEALLETCSFFKPNESAYYEMSKYDSIDIDDSIDFDFAECLLTMRQAGKSSNKGI